MRANKMLARNYKKINLFYMSFDTKIEAVRKHKLKDMLGNN